jgi:23S rRNA (uracil1939-C5)-methyltransferase
LGRNRHFGKIIPALEVVSASAEGYAVARHEGRVIFVKGAVPGDVVDVRINGKKKKFLMAEVVKMLKPSEKRVEPVCEHFGLCGGCKWQHMDYAWQLHFKQQQVVDSMERIGGLSGFELFPILGSEQKFSYRNKMDYAFSHQRWLTEKDMENGPVEGNLQALGFHVPGRFDKVLQVAECHLMHPLHNEIRNAIFNHAMEKGLGFYHLKEQHGLLRNLILRNSSSGEWMLILIYSGDGREQVIDLLEHICTQYPMLTAVFLGRNDKANDAIYDLELELFKGQPYITEEIEGLQFRVQPKSFFQTNPKQAQLLYRQAMEMADLNGHERVYDLYCGTGTISLYASRQCKEVIGIESVPQAIEDAERNATHNNIDNCKFFVGDMRDVLTSEFFNQHGKPDVMITDPPRAGMHPKVVERLRDSDCPKIVYVSCNPATQARDLAVLCEKYLLKAIRPVDMFPHTHHVENVALLVKKDG